MTPSSALVSRLLIALLGGLLALGCLGCGENGDSQSRSSAPEVSEADRLEAARLVERADELFELFEHRAALPLIRQARELNPGHPRARRLADAEFPSPAEAKDARKTWQAGVNLMVAGDPVAAYRRFADATAADPAFDQARLDYARAALTIRRFTEAMTVFDEILAERPALPRAVFAGAEAAYRYGDDERCLAYLEALPVIEARADLEPELVTELPEIRYLQGLVAHRAKKPVVALNALERGLTLAPDNLKIRHLRGGIMLEEGRFGEAAEALKEVLERKPDHADAKINLARALDRDGKKEEAIGWYRSALGQRKRDWELMISLARCQEELGDRKNLLRAVGWLDQALEVNPQAHEAYFSLGNIHRRLGNTGLSARFLRTYQKIKSVVTEQQEQLRKIEKRLDANPRDLDARIEALRIHEEFHHVEDVLAQAKEILRIDPKHAEGLRYAAFAYRLMNKPSESYYEALKLIDAHPEDARGWALAAWNLREREQWEACRQHAKRAFDIDPTHFNALETYLAACQALGQTDEIKRLWPLYTKMRQREAARIEEIKRKDAARQEALLRSLSE
jgi:tetratricopeptide (TPR) repeat protein